MKKQITNFSLGTGEYMINGVRYIVRGKFEDFNIKKKIKNLIICINTSTLSNRNENTKEIYH